ncbi:MAG: ribulose-phosphate 3-epimerase [Rhodothermales bacterium]|jgi:ribulose-phosphate 3-epimerase
MERLSILTRHSPHDLAIAPSLLAADFAKLGAEIRDAAAAGADLFHVDIMDGHFAPNLSMGPPVVSAIRPHTDLLFDVHLMLTNPRAYIEPFVKAGADHITIHIEADDDIAGTLADIHAAGISAGLSLRPGTDPETLRPYLDQVEMLLVMTVEPGFGGQSFRADQLPKIATLREWIDASGRDIHLEVDGGIAAESAKQVREAGANMLVAGSSVFRHPQGIAAGIAALR